MIEQTKEFLRRFKAELNGQGISLREMDEELEEGIRHKFQEGKDRPFAIDDYFRGTTAVKLDPYRLLARIAGYGNPLDLSALRGSRAPAWPAAQGRILKSLEALKKAGGHGFEDARAELRRIEHLHEDDPKEAENATWAWLEHERRPGAVVGLLSARAVHEKKAKAHSLLTLACNILGEPFENAAGGKMATAAGRCFISLGFAREGIHILRAYALGIVDIYGDADEHATVLYHISRAASMIGEHDLSKCALRKAVSLGRERIRFAALQFLAYKELRSGDFETATILYDDLVSQPYFEVAPKQARAAINHSRLAAKSAAGKLGAEAEEEFRAAVEQIRGVMPAKDQVAAVIDFATFLSKIGKSEESASTLEAELWNVLDLDDTELIGKYAGLWEALEIPKDTRHRTLVGRLGGHSIANGDTLPI